MANITKQLIEMFIFCAKNKIEFLMTTDEQPNEIFYSKKNNTVCLNISDDTDKNIPNMMTEKLKELKQLFQ